MIMSDAEKEIESEDSLWQKKGELKKEYDTWLEKLEVVTTLMKNKEGGGGGECSEIELVDDDFKREMYFIRQAQTNVLVGLKKLEKEADIPCSRPEDGCAEMVKTDNQVREELVMRHKRIKASEKSKNKQYGKKIQKEVLDPQRIPNEQKDKHENNSKNNVFPTTTIKRSEERHGPPVVL